MRTKYQMIQVKNITDSFHVFFGITLILDCIASKDWDQWEKNLGKEWNDLHDNWQWETCTTCTSTMFSKL